MECKAPVYVPDADTHVRCGRCLACKVKFRNEWASRVQMEEIWHYEQYKIMPSFITLTYRPDTIPTKNGYFTLDKKGLGKWLSNIQRKIGKFRYFACGEYGKENTKRPHYHLILFPFDPRQPYALCREWLAKYGRAQALPYRNGAAQYVSKYATKFLTHKGEINRNQEPEFRLSSKNPALGVSFGLSLLERVGQTGRDYWIGASGYGDVPACYRIGGRVYPIGKFVRSKMREKYGVPSSYWERCKKWPYHADIAYKYESEIDVTGEYESWEIKYAQKEKRLYLSKNANPL